MRHLFAIIAAFLLCAAPVQAQALKSLMYNTTNGMVVYGGTNALQFTNAISTTSVTIDGIVVTNTGLFNVFTFKNAGPSGIYDAGFLVKGSATNASDRYVGFYTESNADPSWYVAGQGQLFLGRENIDTNYHTVFRSPFTFNNTTNASVSRANLGFSTNLNALWTATNAESARNAIGAGAGGGTNSLLQLPLAISNGGTGATNAELSRASLGLGGLDTVYFGGVVANYLEISDGNDFFVDGTINMVGTFNFANDVQFQNPIGARAALGAGSIGGAVFTQDNAIGVRQILGLQSYTNTLTNSVGDVEIGSTVNTVTFGWTISPTNAAYSVRRLVIGTQTNNLTNNNSTLVRSNLALTSNTTATLTVGDGLGVTNTATTSVNFLNYMSWGRSTNTTLGNAAIQTLHTTEGGASRAFATSRSRSFTMDGGGQYLYVAYPLSFGSATAGGVTHAMIVDGNVFNNFVVTTNTYTNASGHVASYLIYRTANIINGSGVAFTVQ